MSSGNWSDFERELREAARSIAICSDANLVFGEGNRDAKIVLVGEAPGGQEDNARRPFVGPAGKILDSLLREIGLERESVWITNVVKCRPTVDSNGRKKNRAPSASEFDQLLPWLQRELHLVRPDVMVAMGATAAKALLGRKTIKMSETRGRWQESVVGIDTLVTYHPSFLLRRTSQRDERYAEVRDDLASAYARAASSK